MFRVVTADNGGTTIHRGTTRMGRVLVIDDHPETTVCVAQMLRLLGYEVHTALGGETGLFAALNRPFDAIIVDFLMPVVGGLEFLRRLRKARTEERTPVAVVTGDYLMDYETMTELDRLGVDRDRARIGLDQAGEDPHERALPGAVLTEQSHDLAGS